MNEFRSFEKFSLRSSLSPGRCWMNSVQSEKKRFLRPITGNKSTLPMRSHPVTYHLSVVLSALQEFLCKVI